MSLEQMVKKDLHAGFLQIEEAMLKRHGAEMWGYMSQGMQSAYYMGALCALRSTLPKAATFRQAEDGLGDALGIKNMRIEGNKVA